MPIPALDLVWEVTPSVAVVGSGVPATDHRAVLWQLKENMKAAALTHEWTVVGSSNSVAAALDGVDRWVAPANIVWANDGTAHSWIVLQQTGLAPLYQLCIDCTNLCAGAQGPYLTVVVSPAVGFGAGGFTTTRPTAADSKTLLASGKWLGTDNTSPSFSARIHSWLDTTGVATRNVIHINNVPVHYSAFETAQQPPGAWLAADAILHTWLGASSLTDSVLTYAKLNEAPTAYTQHGAFSGQVYLACEGHKSGASGKWMTGINDITSEYEFYALAYRSEVPGMVGRLSGHTAGSRGCWDLWLGSSAHGLPFDNYDAVAHQLEFVQFGSMILPWDSATVPVTA